jgi:hypothetical protein
MIARLASLSARYAEEPIGDRSGLMGKRVHTDSDKGQPVNVPLSELRRVSP